MNRVFHCIILSISLLVGFKSFAQNEVDSIYERHLTLAKQYVELQLFVEGMAEYKKAIEIAKTSKNDSIYISASIDMAELMRKTRDFDNGLEVLANLKYTENYPRLHVRMLGRKIALIHENTYPPEYHYLDTVRYYLNIAIELAEQNNFKTEEAGLKNELGYFISKNESFRDGIPVLLQAAEAFQSFGDTQNYLVVMIHVFEDYMELKDYKRADSLREYLYPLVQKSQWYNLQIDLYDLFSKDLKRRKDTLGLYYWQSKSYESEIKYREMIYNDQMTSFRVLYNTKKYQDKAAESERETKLKALALEREETRTKELTIYLSLLLLVVLSVVILLLRERKLKRELNSSNHKLNETVLKLNETNEKYLDLVVESNHRIKNNLQMVISMLTYTGKNLDEKDHSILTNISSKIKTVSALHKHLYLEEHNEKVSVTKYFNEIVALYREINPHNFSIKLNSADVEMESEALVYFGLIFNEMLANTFEHNKSDSKSIEVTIGTEKDSFTFSYSDGNQYSRDFKEGQGIQLIRNLVKRIEGKNFKLDSTTGRYQFDFYA